MGERRGVYRVLVVKPEGKSPLGRLRRKWENNIKMDLKEVGCGVWTGSIWIRIGKGLSILVSMIRALVYVLMNLRVPHNAGNFLTS